jgi:putative NADH-flavin reductase
VLGPIAGVTSTEISDATRTIVEAMERTGPHRLVIAANDTVLSDDEVTGEFANVTAEHRRDLATLRASAIAWTVVAAPLLLDEPGSGVYDAVIEGSTPGRSITRADYAAALLDALEHDEWIGHAVVVANPPSKRSV